MRNNITHQFTQFWATLWCKTLLLFCGGLASRGVEDELVQWMNNLTRAVLVRVERVGSPPLWWWLTYIYSGLGPLPSKLGGKGSHNDKFERRQVVHLILTKGGLHLQSFWS